MTTFESEVERVNVYLNTVNRLEPEIAPLDRDAALASIAISLKRIADVLESDTKFEQLMNSIINGIDWGLRNKKL